MLWRNREGYIDTTAALAVQRAARQERKVRRMKKEIAAELRMKVRFMRKRSKCAK